MRTCQFTKVVEMDGSILLSGLPPHKEVEIVVLESSNLPGEMESWLEDIRARHPFAHKNKQEILQTLRETRDVVWDERHAG